MNVPIAIRIVIAGSALCLLITVTQTWIVDDNFRLRTILINFIGDAAALVAFSVVMLLIIWCIPSSTLR
jgi:hypothetical protein